MRLSDQTNVNVLGTTIPRVTHTYIDLVQLGILVISTELPRFASMRPNVGGDGLYMAWGPHDSIFMVFGNIVILAPKKMLVAAERDILVEF